MSIKRIHIRYEDDYFNAARPFSLGFSIDEIELGNRNSHWVFRAQEGMQFSRQKNEYVNKEFNLARVRVYFNPYSEMIIPTSLWEATLTETQGSG